MLEEGQAWLYEQVGFLPHEEQLPILTCFKRFVGVSGGDQGGKSMVASKVLLYRMNEVTGPGLFWLVGPDYKQTRKEFFYLVEDCLKLDILAPEDFTKRVDPGEIKLRDGTIIETKSSKNPMTLSGDGPHGIIMCEPGQIDLETFERCMSRVAPRRGWLLMIGSLEEFNPWFTGVLGKWKGGRDTAHFELPSWTNLALYPGGRNDPEILRLERESSDRFFSERIAGKPVPPKGLVFPEFDPTIHVRELEYNPDYPVKIWVDPGYDGAYAIEVVQYIDGIHYIVDEIYEMGLTTESMILVAQNRPWWKALKWGVIDIAGTQHQGVDSVEEVWEKEAGVKLVSKRILIPFGLERMRVALKEDPITHKPHFIVGAHCKGILSEFGAGLHPVTSQFLPYRWKVDSTGLILGHEPEQRFNHGISASCYGLVDFYGYSSIMERTNAAVKYFSSEPTFRRSKRLRERVRK